MSIGRAWQKLHCQEDGAGVLEYALVAGVISVALITAAALFAQDAVTASMTAVSGAI